MPTVEQVARERLAQRPLKHYTIRNYMQTLRLLDLLDLPFESLTVAMLYARLQGVINQGTRRKMAIDLRACTGLPIPCPKPIVKVYDLPPLVDVHRALAESSYAMWGFVMLYGGLRVGESCANQHLQGNVLHVDRQRTVSGELSSAKTCGPVVLPPWLADRYATHDFNAKHNTVYMGVKRAGLRAGLSITPHMLRHHFATNLVNAGASPEILRRQMRHHDVAVSLRYYVQTTQADIARAVESVERLRTN